jgi:excisionase family DNA binding protein
MFGKLKFPRIYDDYSKNQGKIEKSRKNRQELEMLTNEILNIKEVSAYLRVPVSTIYKLVQDGKVPAVKVGKHWRFMKRDLDDLFEQKKLEQAK